MKSACNISTSFCEGVEIAACLFFTVFKKCILGLPGKKKKRLDKYQRPDKPVSVPTWEISVWIREGAQLARKEQSSRS